MITQSRVLKKDFLSFFNHVSQDTPPLVMELQSKWVARILSQKMFTTSEECMLLVLEQDYAEIEELGWPKHHTHRLQMDLVIQKKPNFYKR